MNQLLHEKIEKVYIISPTYELQPTWDPLRRKLEDADHYVSGEQYTRSYTDIKKKLQKQPKNQMKRTLLIIDDASAERSLNEGAKGDFSWLVYNSVWMNLSIVCITHKFSAVSPAMRENPEHVIVFTLLSTKEVEALTEQINVLGNKPLLKQVYDHAVVRPTLQGDRHSFLYIYCGSPPAFFRKFDAQIKVDV